MRWTAVVNPSAGRTALDVGRLEAVAVDLGIDLAISVTNTTDAVRDVVREAHAAGCHAFVAVGGDGTAHVLANALLQDAHPERQTLAIIASGSGSDLVRTFGHDRSLEEGVKRLVDPDLYPLDVGHLTVGTSERFFLNAVNIGVGARSVQVAERLPRRLGSLRYVAAFWIALVRYRTGPVDVRIDHHRFRGKAINVVVANGQFFGGGMNIAPRASTSDGLFDVQVFSGPKRQAITVMPRVIRGTHLTHRSVHRYVGAAIDLAENADTMVEADGEFVGSGPVTIRMVPGAIDLVV